MSDADDIRRWSDELARDPGSLVFLDLAEALRKAGQLELAGKIASRGLARHAGNGHARELVERIAAERGIPVTELGERPSIAGPTRDAARTPEEVTQVLLVDAQGFVLHGTYLDQSGNNVGDAVAAQLSGITEEATRAARLLELGEWRAILVETRTMVVGIAPAGDTAMAVVAAPRSIPLGMVRRLLTRAAARGLEWLGVGL